MRIDMGRIGQVPKNDLPPTRKILLLHTQEPA